MCKVGAGGNAGGDMVPNASGPASCFSLWLMSHEAGPRLPLHGICLTEETYNRGPF